VTPGRQPSMCTSAKRSIASSFASRLA
jgi:hypothetical protein